MRSPPTPVFDRHLWCLSEQLVAVALFDPKLPLGVKRDLVQAIDLQEEGEENGDADGGLRPYLALSKDKDECQFFLQVIKDCRKH